MAEALDVAVGTITGSWTGLLKYMWVMWVVLGLGVIAIIGFSVAYSIKNKQKWNVRFRIRQENKQHGTLYLDPIEIRGKRVTLSNGLRVIYLEKEILGKRLFPNLNHYTRPGVYDIIVTADNRIFLIDGIEGINEDRKRLKVGVRYPGIDYSLDEVNRDHAALNKLDRRSDLLGIVKAASIAIIAIVLLVGVIVGGKYWLDAKEIDAAISQSELQLFDSMDKTQKTQLEQTNAMLLLTEKLKQILRTDNLRSNLNAVGAG